MWSTQSKALVNEAEVDVFLEFPWFFYEEVGPLSTGLPSDLYRHILFQKSGYANVLVLGTQERKGFFR